MAKESVKVSLRQRRIFSDKLKRKVVKDIEQGNVNVLGVSREYQVSTLSVYKWLKKYSSHLHPSTTLVMQMDSEQYRSKELEKKVAELEAALGRKQLEIEYLNKLLEIAGEAMGTDLKKSQYVCIGWYRQNKGQKRFGLNDLYSYLGVSKQSAHQMLQRHQNTFERSQQFIDKAEVLREDHPTDGVQKNSAYLKADRLWKR